MVATPDVPAPRRATRCPVCGARDGRPQGAMLRCGHCGLRLSAAPDGPSRAGRALEELLHAGPVDVATVPGDVLAMDAYTLRSAASARALGFEPGCAEQRAALVRPHSTLPARGTLVPFAPAASCVTLGAIVRASELDAALACVERHRAACAAAVICIDAPGAGEPTARADGTLELRHPLDGGYAAQRNRVQAAAPTRWVLQVDVDEELDVGLLDVLDALVVQADAHGLVSIGLPRRNLVDGRLSDLFPDVQYRLNRREVRYGGRVHERPDLGGAWWRSMIAPGATLTHRLDRARVVERTAIYETMRSGAGRRRDEAALLRPFEP